MSNPMTSREGNSPAQMGGLDLPKLTPERRRAAEDRLIERGAGYRSRDGKFHLTKLGRDMADMARQAAKDEA